MADMLGLKVGIPLSGDALALSYIRAGYSGAYTLGDTLEDSIPLLPPLSLYPILVGDDYRFGAGEMGQVFKIAKGQGVCAQSKVQSKNLHFLSDFNQLTRLTAEIRKLGRERGHSWVTPAGRRATQMKALEWPCLETSVRNVFPEVPLLPALEVLMRAPKKYVASELTKLACDPKIPIRGIELQQNTWNKEPSPARALQLVRQGLKKRDVVGIGFNPDFMRNITPPSSVAYHAASIVGQRWNSTRNRCELLVRDSHGPRCIRDGKYLLNNRHRCEEGHIWVDAEELIPSIYATYLLK